MNIDILLDNEIIINDKIGYYIIRQEGKGYGVYQKYDSDSMLYYHTAFSDMIDALKYVKARLK